MKKSYQITEGGKKELEAELGDLVSRRSSIADKIAAARDYGDLSENAEYDAAREEQGIVETRIAEIEDILQNHSIIQASKGGTVGIGSTVVLKNGAKEVTYQVVGSVEADPMNGKISDESPIGQALIGKKVGEEVVIKTPKGETSYKIISVE